MKSFGFDRLPGHPANTNPEHIPNVNEAKRFIARADPPESSLKPSKLWHCSSSSAVFFCNRSHSKAIEGPIVRLENHLKALAPSALPRRGHLRRCKRHDEVHDRRGPAETASVLLEVGPIPLEDRG